MKYKIWTVLFLVIVVCVSTGMLNAVYINTDPIVQKNERLKVYRSVLEVFNIPYKETGQALEKLEQRGTRGFAPSVEETFIKNVDTKTVEGINLYRSEDGIALEISGSGFWEPISLLIALEPDLETIKGLRILKHAETPGLGARITESWFQDQFKGKKLIPELRIVSHKKSAGSNKTDTVVGATPASKGPNEVDAITGATETSKALERIINSNVKRVFEKEKLK